ncbi:MAG: hypothetical protein V3U54_08650 [Thermodesulfobacteriota bacterium]
MTSTTNLERVLLGPPIPMKDLKNMVLKAASELLLHPKGISTECKKAWGVFLYHLMKWEDK